MFITLEGIDGSGKSTQARMLFEFLNSDGGAVLTREPGGWEGSAPLREAVTSGALLHPWSEVFLFMLDRTEHAARVISPALADGKNVICERYHDSTLAYQSWGRDMPLAPLEELARLAKLPVPDVTILLTLDEEIAYSRVRGRGAPDSFEREGLDFMRKINSGYHALAAKSPERWAVIECGELSAQEVHRLIKDALAARGLVS